MMPPVRQTHTLALWRDPDRTRDDAESAWDSPALAIKLRESSGAQRYRLLSLDEMVAFLHLAYGSVPDAVMERCCRGIAHVSQLLECGEDALARIYAILIGYPEIDPDVLIKLAAAGALRKYNPDWENELRIPAGNSDGGQWTGDGNGGSSPGPSDDIVAMSSECIEEWAVARQRCREYQDNRLLGRHSGFGWTYEQCVRGQVSAACGGNPVG